MNLLRTELADIPGLWGKLLIFSCWSAEAALFRLPDIICRSVRPDFCESTFARRGTKLDALLHGRMI